MKRFLAIALISTAPVAEAQTLRELNNSRGSVVFVWRDREARENGLALAAAGTHRTRPEVLLPLLSCIVPNGSKVRVQDSGLFTSIVFVADGQSAGCRGVVESAEIMPSR